MENRPLWGSRVGFILAAAGSAIGLGNIWRFPAVAYENGGGAFFLPYLFALLTAGIPLLILEFAVGHKYRASAPGSLGQIKRGFAGIGWWQLGISFVISVYYAAVIAWALSYAVFSLNLKWGEDTQSFLFGSYLNLADEPGQFGGLVPGVLIPLIIIWLVALFVLYRGVRKGIEIANKIALPTLFVMFAILVIRAITLDGAAEGLNAFFKPNWDMILDGKVWVAAYGQIFFSLSIGFAIMVTYSSYLKKKSDITNNAFITGFANSGFELLAGIGVFSILGFMAAQQGVGINEVVAGGVGLAFVVFPQIINQLPALNELFGFLFFASLVLAGFTSLISIVETFVAGVQEKFSVTRTRSVVIGGGLAAIISILFASRGGLFFLDVVDYFINNFGVALAGLIEVIAIAWIARKLKDLQEHANSVSDIKVGLWWRICLGLITPVVLGYMMIQNLITNFKENYEGYATWFVTAYGWVVVIAVIVAGIIFAAIRDRGTVVRSTESMEVSE